jgi:hypothetical protein
MQKHILVSLIFIYLIISQMQINNLSKRINVNTMRINFNTENITRNVKDDREMVKQVTRIVDYLSAEKRK